jgi:hypothetical protein
VADNFISYKKEDEAQVAAREGKVEYREAQPTFDG